MRANGFTLLELMIVVAIAGLLAAIAIPNYLEFQHQVIMAEAKTDLAGIYEAEMSFYANYGIYTTRLDAAGFTLVGLSNVEVGFGQDVAPPAGVPQGHASCINNLCDSGCPNITWTCGTYLLNAEAMGGLNGAPTLVNGGLGFTAWAHSHFDLDNVHDFSYSIDQDKNFVNNPVW